MILPVCMKPMDDELLYGWLMRLAEANGFKVKNVYSFVDFYMKQDLPVSAKTGNQRKDYLLSLDTVCDRYSGLKCFPDIVTILHCMTPYCVYAPFQEYGYQAKKAQMILRDKTGGNMDINPINSDVKTLQVCPECMKEDIARHGMVYYHMEHHLPGVHVCAKHHIPLCETAEMERLIENKPFENVSETKLVYPLQTECAIADFMCKLYKDPPYVSLEETRIACMEQMSKRGYNLQPPYGTLIKDLAEWGWKIDEKQIKKIVQGYYITLESMIPFVVYLFPRYEDFKNRVMRYERGIELADPVDLKNWEIISDHKDLLELKCPQCGTRFHIHPYALGLGFGCPACEKRQTEEQCINNQLSRLGDGKYKLVEKIRYGQKAKILHETCGTIRERNIQEVIYGEQECECSYRVSMDKLQDIIGKDFLLLKYERYKKAPYITVRHLECQKSFTISLGSFLKRPRCRCCSPRSNPEIAFKERMEELVKDEYQLVSRYEDRKDMVEIRHKACGTITKMKAENFLYGTRCALCTPQYTGERIKAMISDCTGGAYHVSRIDGHRIYVTSDDGEEYVGRACFLLQELMRPTESAVFKKRNGVFKPKISTLGRMYMEAKECCEKYLVWIPDFKNGDGTYSNRKTTAKKLVNQGYLFRQIKGVYSMEEKIPDEVIVTQKFLERAGKRIGIYYGETLAYHCGIIPEEPDVTYVIGNSGYEAFAELYVRETRVHSKRSCVPITNENYMIIEALELLRFLEHHRKYKEKIKQYFVEQEITMEDIEPYLNMYPDVVTYAAGLVFE